ncbi:hypothetical protein FHR81_000174 [Actinoalloteichus hoggarensis]|uniref:Uncharacterized protein n=1 Tax=Actinoalloteichus hoggarensis TaxID=1470176 RepID=A0A221W2U2_9PSEU|nr:hypothetical protein AHOG_12495 [Actinoalloteichus hoggarensis]MBB5919145.1 hypothetical protein [Actinoalloteichus hoggarensis]
MSAKADSGAVHERRSTARTAELSRCAMITRMPLRAARAVSARGSRCAVTSSSTTIGAAA